MHIAVENFLSEPDGLLGGLGMNNFYLYRFEGTNQSAMIPWDQDLAFEWLESPPPAQLRSQPCTEDLVRAGTSECVSPDAR